MALKHSPSGKLRTMRYIGSKENLLGFLDSIVAAQGFTEGTFCDLFAGTTTVGRHFKRRGFRVLSNDLMHYSFVFGKAYLENNAPPTFAGLELPRRATLFDLDTDPLMQALDHLNRLPPESGFMFQNYCDVGTVNQEHQRMYFSAANAGKIDAVRNQIEQWHDRQVITEGEFYVLLASLLEAVPSVSNTTGTYAAFLKFWESRSQKPLTLAVPHVITSHLDHEVYRGNANDLIGRIECDVLYLDPPYNSRQYAPNYHILETVAKWDAPSIYGKSGLRPYKEEKSEYCQKDTAIQALRAVVCQAQCDLLLLSYNSEGIMPHEEICSVLSERGSLTVAEQDYRRFRSDSDHAKRQYKTDKHVIERVYVLRMERETIC